VLHIEQAAGASLITRLNGAVPYHALLSHPAPCNRQTRLDGAPYRMTGPQLAAA
jgi:hypothetical protein